MRILFIGRSGKFNRGLANWLAKRHQLVGFFNADLNRKSFKKKFNWAKRQIKLRGILRFLDQMAYRIYTYLKFKHRKTDRLLYKQVIEKVFGKNGLQKPGAPVFSFASLNNEDAIAKIKELSPDIIFAVCISEFLSEKLFSIPPKGTYLYHEGLTPEYKGVCTPFWAMYNNECDRMGYTLLKVNEKLDDGPPVVQGIGEVPEDLAKYVAYAGHKCLLDGLPEVEKALEMIEKGDIPETDRVSSASRVYSYPGITDEISLHLKLFKLKFINSFPKKGDVDLKKN